MRFKSICDCHACFWKLHNRIQTASVFGKQGMGHHIAETVIASFLPTGRTVESAGRETLFVPQVLTSSAVQ